MSGTGQTLIGARSLLPVQPTYVRTNGIKHHCVSLWGSDARLQNIHFAGHQLEDGFAEKGVATITPANIDWEFSLQPQIGSNFVFYIDPNGFEEMFQDSVPAGTRLELANTFYVKDPLFFELMRAYNTETREGRQFSRLAVESIALRLNLHLARNYSTISSHALPRIQAQQEDKRIERAKSFIMDNLARPISLAEIAGAAHLSQYHFVRCFKTAEGVTPYQFVIQKRLEMARHMVTETKHSLVEIADMCGFSSQQHLTDAYGKAFGVTPGAMRRRMMS